MSTFTITAHATEHVLVRRAGHPTRVLAPGRHRRVRGASYVRLDARQQLDLVAPQEVLTADGVSVKVSATIRWAVGDAVRFLETVRDPTAVVYLAVQVGLREALASYDADAVVHAGRREVATQLTGVARAAGAEVGVDAHEVVVKDVMLPHELRAAYNDVATGRQRALAQLEAARAETAALRSLANGAKLLDEHPALARMRLVQALPMGSTVKLSTTPPH
jgi:regulator of protease activity HflC (stomatin/prohibitin superfamily)